MQFTSNYDGGPLFQTSVGSPALNHHMSDLYRAYSLPLDSLPNGKIVVFGPPKCGNTWVQAVLSDCLGIASIDPLYDLH